MYTHYLKKPKYTYTLIYINILAPPPTFPRRYQLAGSMEKLSDRPAVHFFIYKNKIMSEEELRSLSIQRES